MGRGLPADGDLLAGHLHFGESPIDRFLAREVVVQPVEMVADLRVGMRRTG